MPTVTNVWTDVHHERQALLELLETLTPEQWDAPSLCADGVCAMSSDTW